jgi:opacity protein-like surface antigen
VGKGALEQAKNMKKQTLFAIFGSLLMWCVSAVAQDGFYGGLALREDGADATGLKLGGLPFAWNRFTSPVAEDATHRALFFGGYRWRSDVSLEAAFNSSDQYALRPPGLRGNALSTGSADAGLRTWSADVFTSWEFVRSLSLYGRVGYAQNEPRPLFAGASLVPGDPRRSREGVNYGLGLRYDMTQALGLRVEYARFGRFAGESAMNVGLLPETDQVTVGVQFKF